MTTRPTSAAMRSRSSFIRVVSLNLV
jgi:hypothetical protein